MFMSITWHCNNFSHYFPTKIQAERNFHHHRNDFTERHTEESKTREGRRGGWTRTQTLKYHTPTNEKMTWDVAWTQHSRISFHSFYRNRWGGDSDSRNGACLCFCSVCLNRAVVVRVTLAHFISQEDSDVLKSYCGESIWQNNRQASITVDHAAITHVHRASSSCMCRGTQEGMQTWMHTGEGQVRRGGW